MAVGVCETGEAGGAPSSTSSTRQARRGRVQRPAAGWARCCRTSSAGSELSTLANTGTTSHNQGLGLNTSTESFLLGLFLPGLFLAGLIFRADKDKMRDIVANTSSLTFTSFGTLFIYNGW